MATPGIHVDDEELAKRRARSDAQTLTTRWFEVLRSLTDLGLDRWANQLTEANNDDSDEDALAKAFNEARYALHRLRDDANAAGHSGKVAPIRSALDRLGALWAVAS